MKRLNKKIISFVLFFSTLLVILSPLTISALNVTVNGHTIADTMVYKGKTINAYYTTYYSGYDSDNSSIGGDDFGYACSGLVKQFYKKVYGVNVSNLYAARSSTYKSGYVLGRDGMYYNVPYVNTGSFSLVNTPQVGDIVAKNNHWMIVKEVKGDKIVVIEQNYWGYSRTYCIVGRQISINDNDFWFFRYSGATQEPEIQYPLIKVTSMPSNIYYFKGENFNPSGLAVTLYNSKDSYQNITNYTLEGFSSAEKGDKKITVRYGSYSTEFTVSVVPYTGNVNKDRVVDDIDVMLLTRYLAKWDDISINLATADVNNDGFVDDLDIMILTRYLAKWNVGIVFE